MRNTRNTRKYVNSFSHGIREREHLAEPDDIIPQRRPSKPQLARRSESREKSIRSIRKPVIISSPGAVRISPAKQISLSDPRRANVVARLYHGKAVVIPSSVRLDVIRYCSRMLLSVAVALCDLTILAALLLAPSIAQRIQPKEHRDCDLSFARQSSHSSKYLSNRAESSRRT